MAVWSSMAAAASSAHLPGAAEALRLIATIVQAAQTARRNKRTCRRLARRVEMVGELLQQPRWSEVMMARGCPPTARSRPLAALEETLRRAHQLVTSCQGAGATRRFLMGAKHAGLLRSVEEEIDSYLLLVPLVSHAVHCTTCPAAKHAATDPDAGRGRRSPWCSKDDSKEAMMSCTNSSISYACDDIFEKVFPGLESTLP
ncbi:unnamed protein product [Urochloa humidicola]